MSQTIQKQLGVDVYRGEQEANTLGPDRKPVDIVLAIGIRHKPSLLLASAESVPPSSTAVSVKLQRASLPYDVSAWTDWNSTLVVTEKTADHFIVRFSTPAPSAPDQPHKLHWLAFRYP